MLSKYPPCYIAVFGILATAIVVSSIIMAVWLFHLSIKSEIWITYPFVLFHTFLKPHSPFIHSKKAPNDILKYTSVDWQKNNWFYLRQKVVIETQSLSRFTSHNKCTLCCPDAHAHSLTPMCCHPLIPHWKWPWDDGSQCSPHCVFPLQSPLKMTKVASCQDVWSQIMPCVFFVGVLFC